MRKVDKLISEMRILLIKYEEAFINIRSNLTKILQKNILFKEDFMELKLGRYIVSLDENLEIIYKDIENSSIITKKENTKFPWDYYKLDQFNTESILYKIVNIVKDNEELNKTIVNYLILSYKFKNDLLEFIKNNLLNERFDVFRSILSNKFNFLSDEVNPIERNEIIKGITFRVADHDGSLSDFHKLRVELDRELNKLTEIDRKSYISSLDFEIEYESIYRNSTVKYNDAFFRHSVSSEGILDNIKKLICFYDIYIAVKNP